MHRSQIIIEDWQYETLKAWAEREGKSISQLMREILDERLGRGRRTLSRVCGIGHDPGFTGRDHDKILYDL
jgi:hypothetical protein